MSARSKADDFLRAMNPQPDDEPAPPPVPAVKAAKAPAKAEAAKPSTRAGLKHIGGYFDQDTVEKVALLRVRLRLDNSELIKLAIEDLHRKHMAKRAFGDA